MGLVDRLRQRLNRTSPQPVPQEGRAAVTAERSTDIGVTAPSSAPPTGAGGQVPAAVFTEPRFAVVDVETTGLSAASHRILEIAVVTTTPAGRVLDTWSTRLNPEGPVGATHIHGITARDVVHAPRFRDVIDDINARLVGAALAGHNACFDLAFLRAEYARAGWRMPFVPALCTLEASTHHLPDLPRRRLIDVCAAVGLPPHRAHSAVHDATATAALLASFLQPGRPPRASDLDMPGHGHAVIWPTCGEGSPLPIPTTGAGGRRLSHQARRNMIASASTPPPKPLVQLLERFSLLDAVGEGAPDGSVAYLEKLAEALEDGDLDLHEAAALSDVADTYDLTDGDVEATHLAFVRALAREAMADGKLTRAERTELSSVTLALAVDPDALPAVLADATSHHIEQHSAKLKSLPSDWAHGEPLRVGDKVVFTGCDGDARSQLEAASEAAGVRVMGGVAKTTAMLVTDGTMAGTKARKATELGTRVVDPDTYRLLLAHLQPAAPTPPPAKPQAPKRVIRGDTPDPTSLSAATASAPTAKADDTAPDPSPAELRAWGRANGWALGDRGRLPKELREAYLAAHAN